MGVARVHGVCHRLSLGINREMLHETPPMPEMRESVFAFEVCVVSDCVFDSAQLRQSLDIVNAKLEKSLLAKSMADAKIADFEREKSMIELEIKELLARHRTEVTERMARAAQVRRHYLE